MIAHRLRLAALGAFIALGLPWGAQAQNSFPTPGGATVPAYVTMCLTGPNNTAIPCNPGGGGGGLAAGAAVTGCPAQSSLFVTSALQLGCVAPVSEADSGDPLTLTGQLNVKPGALTSPSVNWGSNTGFFGVGGSSISIAINGVNQAFFSGSGLSINAGTLTLPNGALVNWGGGTFLAGGIPANATLRMGSNDNAAPTAQTLAVQNVSAGTSNTAGVNWILNGSRGTGTGGSGKIILQGGVTGTTGTAQNTLAPMLTLTPGTAAAFTAQLGDGANFTTYDSCTGFTTSATGVIACTTSAMRFKDMFPAQALNLIGLDALRTDIPWKYRDDAAYGLDPSRVHVGLFADDVEKLDARCVTYRDGKVADYEDRCLIAYLVADRKQMKAEIEALKAHRP